MVTLSEKYFSHIGELYLPLYLIVQQKMQKRIMPSTLNNHETLLLSLCNTA